MRKDEKQEKERQILYRILDELTPLDNETAARILRKVAEQLEEPPCGRM